MSNVRVLDQNKLKQSTNCWVAGFRKNQWVSASTADSRNGAQALIDSYRGACFHGLEFGTSEEFRNIKDNQDKIESTNGGNCDRALKKFLKRVFFPQSMNDVDLDKTYAKIQAYHHQAVWGFGMCAVTMAISPNYVAVDNKDENNNCLSRDNNLSYDHGKILLSNRSFNIKIKNMCEESELMSLPGSIEAKYVLTDEGFKLIEVTVSNSLLEEIVLNEHVDLTPEKIAAATSEELKNAFDHLEIKLNGNAWSDDNSRQLSRLLLEETKKIFDAENNSLDQINKLTDIMGCLCTLIDSKKNPERNAAYEKALTACKLLDNSRWSREYSILLENCTKAIYITAILAEYAEAQSALNKKISRPSWDDEIKHQCTLFLAEANKLKEQAKHVSTIEILATAIANICELSDADTLIKRRDALKKVSATYETLNRDPWSRALSTLLWNLASAILATGSMLAISTGVAAPIGVGLGMAAAAAFIYGTSSSLFKPTPAAKALDNLKENSDQWYRVNSWGQA